MPPLKRPSKAEKALAKAETQGGGAEKSEEGGAKNSGSMKLTAKALAKANLEEVSSKEKVALVKTQHPEDGGEQAKALRKVLAKDENSKIRGQHQRHLNLKRNFEEAQALENASKIEKGLAKSPWLLRKNPGTFHHVQAKEKCSATSRSMTGLQNGN